jgi:hypothetical protein
MKKILLPIIISSLYNVAIADMTFNMSIPQPDYISNDWDNDGIINSEDNDDDNDGILDENDSNPFDHDGQSSTPNVIVKGFHTNKTSYFIDEDVTLSWNVDNIRSLSLYDDFSLSNLISDVTDQSSILLNPIGDVTYYLDSETNISELSVYQFHETDKNCELWLPLPSTIGFGEYFDQNRECTLDFSSNEPATRQLTINEIQSSEGTLLDPVVNSFESTKLSYYPGEELTLIWSVDNIRSLNLYDNIDLLEENHIANVTSSNSINITPFGDKTYYLNTEVSVPSVSVFEYTTAPQICTTWLPNTSSVFEGQNVNQSRTCSITHTSNQPSTIVDTTEEDQIVSGTKLSPVINSFSPNKISYFSGESISLSWNVSNKGILNLYDNSGLTSLVANVSSVNSKSVTPSGNKTYYLKTETGVASTSVYQYTVSSNPCTTWTPAASTVNVGSNVNQTRTCTTNYTSQQPSSTSTVDNQSQTVPGTKAVKVCTYYNTGNINVATMAYSLNGNTNFIYYWSGIYIGYGLSNTPVDINGFTYSIGARQPSGALYYYQICRSPI